jgi:methionine-S-sulfoxide reductase
MDEPPEAPADELTAELTASYWAAHDERIAAVTFRAVARQLPGLVGKAVRLGWEANRGDTAATIVLNLVSGIFTGFALLATTGVLEALFAAGPTPARVRAALPSLIVVAIAVAARAGLQAAAGWSQSRLEPQVNRLVELRLLDLTTQVELAAFDDPNFNDAMLRARDRGTFAANRVVSTGCPIDPARHLQVASVPILWRREIEMGDNAETAVLAGGCAWTMQQLLRHPEGVISTRTGFMGGENDNPTEENNRGHAEVVEVIFDPGRLSYRGLLEVFFQVHRADLDEGVVGSLYRSEIFYTSPEQRTVAEEMIRDVDASGHWPGKTVTRISEVSVFWEMGPEDQDYFMRFPHGCKPPFPRQHDKFDKRPALA